jgi:uncharacterized protein (UPF0332 family)
MLDDKKLKEVEYRIKNYLAEEIIKTKQGNKHVKFFLANAKDSLDSARALYDLSTNKDFQKYTGYTGLRGFLWVINASYYSMFYTAQALLESEGVKVKSDVSIHALIFDALVYFFYLTRKLQKGLFKYYVEAKEEAAELLGQQKAEELVEEYFFEKGKRASFTYQIGEFAMKNKALTSLKRAKKFNREIRKVIKE